MKDKIRRGIDCVCDNRYICRYHWNKIKWRGTILGVILSVIIFGSVLYSEDLFLQITTGLMGIGVLGMVAMFIYWFIKW